jgi:hypothetical protein
VGKSDAMEHDPQATPPAPRPEDATPPEDAPSDRDLAPEPETSQDAVEDVDAERESGPGKS